VNQSNLNLWIDVIRPIFAVHFRLTLMKIVYSLAFLVLSATFLHGQSEGASKITEVGLSLNMLHYSGDLAEKRIVFGEGEFGFGLHVRRELSRHVSLLAQGLFGRIAGDDANNSGVLRDRKYRFFSPIREFSLIAEIYPLRKPWAIGLTGASMRPFVLIGGAVVGINPRAEYYGVGNSPFPEDGLKKTLYSTPMGVGVRADVYERVSLCGSIGWRPVYSDYLDGVAKKGNPENPDWYTNFQIGFSYILTGTEGTGFE
jgi:hypothetical protein